jgi:hypothetical protein
MCKSDELLLEILLGGELLMLQKVILSLLNKAFYIYFSDKILKNLLSVKKKFHFLRIPFLGTFQYVILEQ